MTKSEKPLGKAALHKRLDELDFLRTWEKAEIKKMFAKDKSDAKVTAEQFDNMVSLWRRHNVEDRLFFQRGNRFGTVNESWDAVREMAAAFEECRLPSVKIMDWFSSAVQRCNGNDATDLVRQLGLFIHGRHRVVDPETVTIKVKQLIESGTPIMTACERVADEMGCSLRTVYRWYHTGRSK